MKDIKGFAFFNSGPESGYSQDHKHIQLLPFISFPHLPIKPIVNSRMGESEVFRIPEYPFQHLFHKLTNQDGLSVKGAYDRLMSELQVRGSYNMILTKSWMLIVPRNKNVSLERFDINALAYAGLIFIKKQEDYDFMKKVGVIEILKDGAFPL
jgi:ATP adenylyltransferase